MTGQAFFCEEGMRGNGHGSIRIRLSLALAVAVTFAYFGLALFRRPSLAPLSSSGSVRGGGTDVHRPSNGPAQKSVGVPNRTPAPTAAVTRSAKDGVVSGNFSHLEDVVVVWQFVQCKCSGFFVEALTFVMGLSRHIPHIGAIVVGKNCCPLPEKMQRMLDRMIAYAAALESSPKKWHTVDFFVADAPPTHFYRQFSVLWRKKDRFAPRLVIGRSMLETDRIFDHWGTLVWQYADEMWVPSRANKAAFDEAIERTEPVDKHSIVKRPRVTVIPECLLDDIWRDSICFRDRLPLRSILSPEDRQRVGRPFRFLSTFAKAFGGRKGSDVLLRAFFEAFRDNDDVQLHIHTTPEEFRTEQDIGPDIHVFRRYAAMLYRFWGYDNVPQSFLERIVAWTEKIPLQDMPCEYGKYDAFVLPTRGEGWGLPIMEAMAAGVPVIVTNYSAIPDYVHDDCGYLVAYSAVPATGELYVDTGGRWAEPSKSDLRRLMRHVALHPKEAHLKGLKGQEYVRRHHNQEVCAQMILERMDQLLRPKT